MMKLRLAEPAQGVADHGRRRAGVGAEVIVVEMSVPRDFLGVGPARTIVADVDMATRKRRLVDKGMPLDDVNRRMANQPDRNGWIERGGWVICTDGTLEDVEGRVDRLWPQIESLS